MWNPFGNLIPVDTIIRYTPNLPLDNGSSLIFSPLIFSSASIDWLNHEYNALNHAIAAILDKHSDQMLTKIVNSTLSTTNQKQNEAVQDVNAPENNLFQKEPITGLDQGNLFFDWLRDEIEKENQSVLALGMRVDTGIAFKTPMIFKSFAKHIDCEWEIVEHGFNKLKVNRKLTDMNGKSFDVFKLSKSNNDQWSIINSKYFSMTTGVSQKIDFFDWLLFILRFQINHYLEEKPSYIITTQYIYLVVPHIFNIYASIHDVNEEDIESSFLSLGIHIINNGSDYFKYTLNNNETLNTLKLKRSLEFYPQI